jgi:hypothetical protein
MDQENISQVIILWKDAVSHDAWDDLKECVDYGLPLIKSIGFLVEETSDAYFLAQNLDTVSSNVSAVMVIPKSMVEDVIVL